MNGGARLRLLGLAALVALASGCAQGQVRKSSGDPDRKSGPDRTREGAQQRQLDQDVTDHVAYHLGDRTDWHYFDVTDFGGKLGVTVKWPDTQSELDLVLYDAAGEKLLEAPVTPGQQKTLEMSPIDPGRYFVRVRALENGDDTDYTLRAIWTSNVDESTDNPEAAPTDPGKGARTSPGGKRAEQLQARIISAQAEESGGFTVHIDKGSAAGVKVGTIGAILEGPSGAAVMRGSAFKIVKVVDENKSIGKSNKTLNVKSKRVVLFIK